MSAIVIILIVFVKYSINFQINPINSYNLTNLLDESLKFGNDEKITYATSSVDIADFYEIYKNTNPHMIYNFNRFNRHKTTQNRINYDFYMIFDQNLSDFNQTLSRLFQINNLYVHAKYFVFIHKTTNRADIVGLFQFLFKEFEIYNIILMNNQTFFTWFPYKNNCNENITIEQIPSNNLSSSFDKKLPKKLNNCTFHVAEIWTTISVKLTYQLAEILNVQLSVSDGPKFNILNATVAKDLNKNLKQWHIDMVHVYEILPDTPYHETFQYSSMMWTEEYYLIFLPPKRLIPKWKEFKVFTNEMILAIVITIIISAIVYALLTKQSLQEALFRMYQLCLQLSLNMLPKEWRLRLYFVFLLFFVNILSAGYLTVMSGVFTRPSLEPKITTLQQFFDSDIPIMIYREHLELLKSLVVENKRKPWPKQKFLIPTRFISANEPHDDYAVLLQVIEPPHSFLHHPDVFPALSSRHASGFIYRPRFHLSKLIDSYIRLLHDTGHVSNYNRDNELTRSVSEFYGFKLIIHENVVVLSMYDLSGVFIVWLIGLGCSLIVFLFEIITYKRDMRLRRILRR